MSAAFELPSSRGITSESIALAVRLENEPPEVVLFRAFGNPPYTRAGEVSGLFWSSGPSTLQSSPDAQSSTLTA